MQTGKENLTLKSQEIIMKNQIKERSIVKIDMENSPIMQVEKMEKDKARCFWFDKNEVPRVKTFFLNDLILVEDNVKNKL
jgi:hypothetical protein